MDRAAVLALADVVLDYKSNSYVEAARSLSQFVKRDEEDRRQLVDNLSTCQARCTELLEDRRALCKLVDKLRAASPDERDSIVAAMVTCCRGFQ